MKKFLIIALACICAFVLFGCAAEPEPQPTAPAAEEQPEPDVLPEESPKPEPTPTPLPKRQQDLNIAVSVYDENSADGALFLDGIEQVFKSKKNKYEVLSADGSSQEQSNQISNAATSDFDALIVKTDAPEAVAEAVKKAAGVMPVITVSVIDGVAADYTVNTKEEQMAQEAAQVLADSLEEGKRAVIISTGEPSDSLSQKEQAFIDAAEAKDLKILRHKNVENREQAVAAISNWMLANPYIKAIWAPTPDALSAALEITSVMERTDVKIGGLGEDLDLIAALGDERLTVLGTSQPKTQGELTARAALVLGADNYYSTSAQTDYFIYTPEQYNEAALTIWDTDLIQDEETEEDQEEN